MAVQIIIRTSNACLWEG